MNEYVTLLKVEDLKPGLKLDELIAKSTGSKYIIDYFGGDCSKEKVIYIVEKRNGEKLYSAKMWSRNILDAKELQKEILDMGATISIFCHHWPEKRFSIGAAFLDNLIKYIQGETEAHAICLLYLRVKGIIE